MNLGDFSIEGFSSLSRFFSLRTREDAEALDTFLESMEVVEAFDRCGPGTYYVMYDEGFDRSGRYSNFVVKKMHSALTPNVFFDELKELHKVVEYQDAPFNLARTLRNNDDYESVSDDERALLARMDLDASENARLNLFRFLRGE